MNQYSNNLRSSQRVVTDASKENFVIDCDNIEEETSNSLPEIDHSKIESGVSMTNEFDCQIPDEQNADTVMQKITVIQSKKINLKNKE